MRLPKPAWNPPKHPRAPCGAPSCGPSPLAHTTVCLWGPPGPSLGTPQFTKAHGSLPTTPHHSKHSDRPLPLMTSQKAWPPSITTRTSAVGTSAFCLAEILVGAGAGQPTSLIPGFPPRWVLYLSGRCPISDTREVTSPRKSWDPQRPRPDIQIPKQSTAWIRLLFGPAWKALSDQDAGSPGGSGRAQEVEREELENRAVSCLRCLNVLTGWREEWEAAWSTLGQSRETQGP